MPDNPAFDRETWEERAAIREFDGGYSREEAERLAMDDLGINDHFPDATNMMGKHGKKDPAEAGSGGSE